MIPLIEAEVVAKRRWLDREGFLELLALAQAAPGVIAMNIAVFVGYQIRKNKGVAVTTLGAVLPSFIIIYVIARFLHDFLKYKKARWALDGVKPVIVGLLFAVVLKLVNNNILGGAYDFNNIDYIGLAIMVLMFSLKAIYKKISPVFLIIISALLGLVLYQFF